ncbi:MAG: hypothetical protein MUF16_16440, partial [Burkholderiaceae bacterium]|nr:hypothetical protein [Burkholderiaceae bacterium]
GGPAHLSGHLRRGHRAALLRAAAAAALCADIADGLAGRSTGAAASAAAAAGRPGALAAFNQVLFRTFRLELVFAVLLACGALLDRLWTP